VTEAIWNRDEFDDIFGRRSELERFFGNQPQWRKPSAIFEKAWKPLCDVFESPDHFTIVVELAWVDEEKVEVTLHGRLLSIRGHRRQFRPEDICNTYMLEINYGEFERVLELPTDIDADATRAIYRRGLLEIILPKLKRDKLRGVDISSE
jgi:HSP20 family protein